MKAGGAASKRRRRGRGVSVDRISALPDAVLGEIVSLLPTREGALTKILASRWRHIWRSAPLNLDCRGLGRHGVVPRILSSHQGPGRRFRINAYTIGIPSDPDDPAYIPATVVDDWLRSPTLDNLQELYVFYALEDPVHPLPSSVPRFSATLQVVSLGNCSLSDSAVQGLRFPKLTRLALKRSSISECSLNNMIVGCPALECLMIDASFGFHCIRINSRSLMTIGLVAKCYRTDELLFGELIIENAPCLRRLLHLDQGYLSTGGGLTVSVLSAPTLEMLRCRILDDNCLPTKLSFGSTIIQGLHVDSLRMVVHTVKILAVALNQLNLDIVINLLRCFPCLEELYIEVNQSCQTNETNLWIRKYRNLVGCFDIRLKTIMLRSYRGSESDVNFVTFFVLNAKVLESMTLVAGDNNEEFIAEQSRKLQLDNKASRGAEFHFASDRHWRIFGLCSYGTELTDPFASLW